MSSHYLDFSSCRIVPGFCKSVTICFIIIAPLNYGKFTDVLFILLLHTCTYLFLKFQTDKELHMRYGTDHSQRREYESRPAPDSHSTRPRLALDPPSTRTRPACCLLTRELLAFIHPPYILLTALLLAMHVPYM